MDIDLCNLAKQLADGDISEDEFKHQRTKIIQHISQGKANGVTDVKAREHISRDDAPAENDDIFYQVAQLARARKNNRNNINMFVALPVVLLIGMAITLMLIDTSAFENNAIPVKHPVSTVKKQRLTMIDKASQASKQNSQVALLQPGETSVNQAEPAKQHAVPKANETAQNNKAPEEKEQQDESHAAVVATNVTPEKIIKPTLARSSAPEKSSNTKAYQQVAVKPETQPESTAKTRARQELVEAKVADSNPVNTASLSSTHVSRVGEDANPSLESKPAKQITKPTMADIQELIMQFTNAYENGDLELFTSLFAKNARTNDQTNRNGIREEYQQVFKGTEGRQMFLTDFNWDLYNGEAEGKGRFELLISPKNTANVQKYSGEVELILKEEDDKVVISEMRHTEKSDS